MDMKNTVMLIGRYYSVNNLSNDCYNTFFSSLAEIVEVIDDL